MNMQYLFIYLFRCSDETQFLIFFQTKKLKIMSLPAVCTSDITFYLSVYFYVCVYFNKHYFRGNRHIFLTLCLMNTRGQLITNFSFRIFFKTINKRLENNFFKSIFKINLILFKYFSV